MANEAKTDCVHYTAGTQERRSTTRTWERCTALKELYCKYGDGKCNFYKPKNEDMEAAECTKS